MTKPNNMISFKDSLKIIFKDYEFTIYKRKNYGYLVHIPRYDLKIVCTHKICFNNKEIERALTNPKYTYVEKNLYSVDISNKYHSISNFFFTISDLENFIVEKLKICEQDLL
jgi:hypothetical protein